MRTGVDIVISPMHPLSIVQHIKEGIVNLRDFLREQRSRFPTQEDMLDYIEERTGRRFSQPAMSTWLSGEKYPDRQSRTVLRQAFNVPGRIWWKMLAEDAALAGGSH